MGDQKLTKRQRQILDFLGDFEGANGYAPSYREIAAHIGIASPSTIHEHIKGLEEKGFIKSGHNEARSIELIHFKTNWAQAFELSLAGLITAGEPIEAVEERDTVTVPGNLVRDPANSFVLKVRGDSMVEDGILDGDLVVCRRTEEAQNGDVVVALIDNQYATLKRFYKEAGRIRLQPANSQYQPLYPAVVAVQGIVCGLIRQWA